MNTDTFISAETTLPAKFRKWSGYLIVLVLLISMMALAGWIFRITFFNRLFSKAEVMHPVSAVTFIIASVSFLLLTRAHSKKWERTGYLLALVVLQIGLIKLFPYITGYGIEIDWVLVPHRIIEAIAEERSNLMAPNAVFNFVMIGIALLVLNTETRSGRMYSQYLALIIAFIGLFSIVGYLYQVEQYFGILTYIPMAFRSAVNFFLLSVAILVAHPEKGLMKEFSSPYTGSIAARLMIPVTIVIPVLLGLARLYAGWKWSLPFEMGTDLLVISIVITFLVILWNLTRLLNKRDYQRRKTEMELFASEKQIQAIFNGAPDAVIVIDEEGKVIKWNPKAESLFGWNEAEVLHEPLSDFIIPFRYRDEHNRGMRHFFETGSGPVLGKSVELQGLKKDATEIDVALSISPVRINDKTIFIGFVRDISDRKRADEAIRQTNYFLDTILENIPNMIYVKDAKELKFIRLNKAGEKLFGRSRTELIGKNDYDFFSREQADFFTSTDMEVLRKKELVDIPEESISTRSGKRLLHTRKIPILSEFGTPVYLLGISEDITEQKKAEQHLKDLNERFIKIFNLSPVAMSISTKDEGRIIQVNETFEKLFMVSSKDVAGKTTSEAGITSPDDRQQRMQELEAARGKLRGVEMRLRKSNGESIDVIVSIETIEIENKPCLLTAAVDITRRKKTEEQISYLNTELEKNVEQLQLVNKELEAFTYSVSHDLRAPLRIIDGYSGILVSENKGQLDESILKMLDIIRGNAKKMGLLIDSLLNLSRLGKQELQLNKVDMNEVVSNVIEELLQAGKPEHLEIKTGNLHPALCDRQLVHQVWFNLLSNAVKYSAGQEKPVVETGSWIEDNEVIYFVKDNGVGFDMKYSEKLFGIFQRLHKVTEFEGTGVGLAIVHRIVSRHQGRIWAEAEENKGATFYFTLPVADGSF